MKKVLFLTMFFLLYISTATAQSDEWQLLTGEENLRNFMSGREMKYEDPEGRQTRGEYRADGTGTLYSWGAKIPRTWAVKGDDQICVSENIATRCYQFEKNVADPSLYRVRDVSSGRLSEVRVTGKEVRAVVKDKSTPKGNKGGPSSASASEIAKELSNPNTALASLTFKNQFRLFEGDLPHADREVKLYVDFPAGFAIPA